MPGREGYVLSGGFKVHYAEWGTEGLNVVLMHSMGMDCHSMDRVCETLQKEYRVLALTNLGHEYSDIPSKPVMLPEHANILRSAVAKLGYVPYTLIGHSVYGT